MSAGGMQYRKPSSLGGPGGREGGAQRFDWEAFDETLARVDPRFCDPRFDSLKHVLTVLSSNNAEAEVEELREQRGAVEELVEGVVEAYHSGFNKAAHNYSQILRLFAESKQQLETLRRSLGSAARRLSARSRHLAAQYQRDQMLSDTLRLLDDIQACVAVPARLQRLQEGREWPLAVSLLLDACNKLARQELAAVGALQELGEEMGRRRQALLDSLVAELEARAYHAAPTDAAAALLAWQGDPSGAPPGGGGGTGGGAVPRLALSALQPRGSSQEVERQTGAGNLSGRGLPPRAPAPGPLARTASWGWDGGGGGAAAAAAGPGGSQMASLASLPRRPTHRRAQTLGGLAPAAHGLTSVDGHLVDSELPLTALVDCVAQLGGLHDAQHALRRRMPRQLRALILRALDSFPAALRPPPDDQRWQQQQRQQEAGASGDDMSVPPAVAAAAAALAEHVLGCCLQAFQQVTRVLHMLSLARTPKPSSGLELLLSQQQLTRGGGGPIAASSAAAPPPTPMGPPGAEATRREVAAAWECLQAECQLLLADLLGAAAPAQQAQQAQRGAEQADVPAAGWLAAAGGQLGGAGVAAAGAGEAPLPFSLEHEVGGLLPRLDDDGDDDGGDGGAASTRRERIRSLLGGHPGGPALVAPLYRPVLAFADAAERHLASLSGGGAEPAGRMAALLGMPWRGAGDGGAERSPLRAHLDSFLRMEFLPAVYVSARARCSAALEDPEAFKPRTRLRAPYQLGSGGEGRPMLPAALAAQRMVQELLGWAALVPPFATHLTGVVENVLGRVADAFELRMGSLLGGSAAGRLAESLPVVQLMAKEPAAALLGSPVAFFVGRNTEAMESFVSSVIAAGFGANDEGVEGDILRRLMAERPVPAAALLSAGGDVRRLAALAALSDSLEQLADAVQSCASPAGGGRADRAAGEAPPPPARSERLSSDGGGSGASTPVAADVARQGSGAAGGGAAGPSWSQQLLGGRLKGWRRGAPEGGGPTEGLIHLCDRCRALAGQCVRALRLDLLLLVLHHLQQLPATSYVCSSEEEAREVDECVAALARLVGRLDEGLEPLLPPHKRVYVFGSLAAAAARFAIWLLPDIRRWNQRGVQRMCRMLASLQPALQSGAGGGAGGGSFRPDAARQFDRAKLYFTLLTYSAEGLVATAAERPHRFTAPEYMALLAADVAERPVTPEHRAALQRVLTEAGQLAKPASKANAALQAIARAIKQ